LKKPPMGGFFNWRVRFRGESEAAQFRPSLFDQQLIE